MGCVVNIKFVSTDCEYLIIQVIQNPRPKLRQSYFLETRLFVWKVENFEELQLPQGLVIFCWNFTHVSYLTMSTKGCSGFFFYFA